MKGRCHRQRQVRVYARCHHIVEVGSYFVGGGCGLLRSSFCIRGGLVSGGFIRSGFCICGGLINCILPILCVSSVLGYLRVMLLLSQLSCCFFSGCLRFCGGLINCVLPILCVLGVLGYLRIMSLLSGLGISGILCGFRIRGGLGIRGSFCICRSLLCGGLVSGSFIRSGFRIRGGLINRILPILGVSSVLGYLRVMGLLCSLGISGILRRFSVCGGLINCVLASLCVPSVLGYLRIMGILRILRGLGSSSSLVGGGFIGGGNGVQHRIGTKSQCGIDHGLRAISALQ